MKRIVAISLMLIQLTFSVGIVIGYHFCGGKLGEIAFYQAPKSCCADANSEKSCCQNSIAVFKITDTYSCDFSAPDVPHAKLIGIVEKIVILCDNCLSSNDNTKTFEARGIRHLSKIPIYLSNQVFII
jgi:hypothetical protein